ncbi:MAG: FprA family A-type flavoprotein [Coriobacteriales bacterium]|nr:FprA family A-type flavoprotein [Coriobacteriales bacterium]
MLENSDIIYVGVNDHDIDLFEGQYDVPNGMAYNSYIVRGERIAVMDSVDARFGQEWLAKIDAALAGAAPDFLIVQHMEPDHSGSIIAFMERYPAATVVSNAKSFPMMKAFFGTDFEDRRIAVKEGETLDLGGRALSFINATMVHWPEVIMTYDAATRTVFSADAFGKFGALDVDEDWACEARRYYFGIVGKYGNMVQGVLKKLAKLDVARICPLHGPVLEQDLPYHLDLYNTWSSYGVETDGVAIFYTSVYGNTKAAAQLLASLLGDKGVRVALTDLARDDMAEAVEDAFRYGKVVLATTTYNGDIFPFMREFIHELTERNFRGRRIAFIENGSWAATAAKVMAKMLEGCKDTEFLGPVVTLRSAMSDANREQLAQLADVLAE